MTICRKATFTEGNINMSLLDALKVKQADMESKKQRDFAITPPPGNSRWRIFPSFDGDLEKLPVADFGQHFIKDPKTGETLAVVGCAAKIHGTQCDICDQIMTVKAGLLAEGRDAEAKIVDEAKSGQKHIVNAVRWTKNSDGSPGGTYGDKIQQLALPMTGFEQFMLLVESYLAEGINFFDMNTGYDIIITRSGTGRDTKYTVQSAPTSSVAPAELFSQVIDLTAYVNQITEEKRQKALSALGGPRRLAAPAATPALPAAVAASAPTVAVVIPAAPAAAPAAEVAAAPAAVPVAVVAAAAPVADIGGAAPAADALADVDLENLDLADLEDVT